MLTVPKQSITIFEISTDERQPVEIKLIKFCGVVSVTVFYVGNSACYHARKTTQNRLTYDSILASKLYSFTNIYCDSIPDEDGCMSPLHSTLNTWIWYHTILLKLWKPTLLIIILLQNCFIFSVHMTHFWDTLRTVSGPTLWNSLPLSVRDPSLTLTQFCASLQTVLFCRAYETLA